MKLARSELNLRITSTALLLAVWVLLILVAGSVSAANVPGIKTSQKTDKEIELPENMTSEEVDAYLAGISDEQARKVLARKLKQGAAGNSIAGAAGDGAGTEDAAGHFFHRLTLGASLVLDQIASFFAVEEEGSIKWETIINRLSGGKGLGHLLVTLLIGLGIIAVGVIVERLVLRITGSLRQQILTSGSLGKLQRLGRFVSRLMLDALGIAAYMLTTFVLLIILFRQEDAGYWIVSNLLISTYYLLVIILAARIVMSPATRALRLLPLQDQDAVFLYRWIVRISVVAAIFITPGIIFLEAGRSETLFNLFFIASGLSVSLLMIAMIWQSRHRVAEAICAGCSRGRVCRIILADKICPNLALFCNFLCGRIRDFLVD